MVRASTVSRQIQLLNQDICGLECRSKFVLNGSKCCQVGCKRKGNSKVTNSHCQEPCLNMKRSNARVSKTELFQSRSRSAERKDVYKLGSAQVEAPSNCSSNDYKIPSERACKTGNKPKRVVSTGTDPIRIVESKLNANDKCWASLLHENARSNLNLGEPQRPKAPLDPPQKLTTGSKLPEPKRQGPKAPVLVRDRGIQCHSNFDGSTPLNYAGSYNPLSTLQVLLTDLKSFQRSMHGENGKSNLNSIISEMSRAVNRLADGGDLQRDGRSHQVPEKLSQPGISTAEKGRRKGESLESLQATCERLQSSCLLLEQTCQKLHKEKDHVTEKFFEKSRELESCLRRELEYQAKLNDARQSVESMTKKLDEYTKSMEELSLHVTRLQAENQVLLHAKEVRGRLVSQLMEATKENEKLNNEMQLMTLEREKNKVLLDVKEQELAKLKAELRCIGGLVSEKMLEGAVEDMVVSSPDGTLTSPSKSWKALSSILSPPLPTHTEGAKKRSPLESLNALKAELHDLFAEMKEETDVREESEISRWSTLTDSSDGYNTISENQLSTTS